MAATSGRDCVELLAIHSKYKGLVEGYLYAARSSIRPRKMQAAAGLLH